MSTETLFRAEIPAGATILRVIEKGGVRSVEVSIPMKEAPPSFFGMDLGTADESVEGIVATPDSRSDRSGFTFDGSQPDFFDGLRDEFGAITGCACLGCVIIRGNKKTNAAPAPAPVDDVVDAEFDPGAVQQDTPNPERPNPITAEWFKASVGQEPGGDDLDRCNCRRPGAIGHMYCGWDDARDMPNFVPGLSKRPDFLLARIAELEALLNAPHASKAAEMAAGEPGQPRVMELAEELALWGPWTGKIGEDPLYLYACEVAIEIGKNASRPPQLIIAPLYSGLCARLRGDA